MRPTPFASCRPCSALSCASHLSITLISACLMTALLVACGGGGGGSSSAPTPPVASPPTEGALAASRPGELLEYVKTKLRDRLTQRQTTPGLVFVTGGLAGAVTTTAAGDNTGNRSGTVVQEQGVDEDDLLKTDGSMLYTLSNNAVLKTGQAAGTLQTWRRAADGSVSAAGSLPVTHDPDSAAVTRGLLLAAAAQRAVVLGESQLFYALDVCGTLACDGAILLPNPQTIQPSVHVDIVSVANFAAPALAERWRIDGRLVGSRLIGNQLYLVTQHGPQLAFDALPLDATQVQRDALLTKLTVADILPTIRINGGAAQPLVAETDCFVQPKNASPGIEITVFTVVDLSATTPRPSSRCFAGGSEALYVSSASLYIATSRWAYAGATNLIARLPGGMTTDVHKFAIGGSAMEYRGSGEVAGHLGWDVQRKSYRMSEFNGDLRMLTYTGETGWGQVSDTSALASPAQLTILRERASDRSLHVVSTLPNAQRPAPLGKPREQVYAVRFIGNRGYVVTFQRTDPLYVIDLANPADPKTVGELEVTGFSDYLFPITENLLLGVGKDADARGVVSGVKVALIDLSDPTRPRQAASRTFGGPPSQSGLDVSRHGIDLFTRGNLTRVALPVALREDYRVEPTRGLQRLEIDALAKTMSTKPLIASPSTDAYADLYQDRSVQIEDKLYYFSGGKLTAWAW